MPESDLELEPPEFACPNCGEDFQEEEPARGKVFRCPSCESWLFRRLFDSGPASDHDRCRVCRGEVPGSACPFCGTNSRPSLRDWLARKLAPSRWIHAIRLDRIRADGFYPRLSTDLEKFESLRHSLDQLGMIEPILLRHSRQSSYCIISGHRRFLAAKSLGWSSVPARILKVGEREALSLRIRDNLDREEWNPIELAEALERYFLLSDCSGPAGIGAELGLANARVEELLGLLEAAPDQREALLYDTRNTSQPASAGQLEELLARSEGLSSFEPLR